MATTNYFVLAKKTGEVSNQNTWGGGYTANHSLTWASSWHDGSFGPKVALGSGDATITSHTIDTTDYVKVEAAGEFSAGLVGVLACFEAGITYPVGHYEVLLADDGYVVLDCAWVGAATFGYLNVGGAYLNPKTAWDLAGADDEILSCSGETLSVGTAITATANKNVYGVDTSTGNKWQPGDTWTRPIWRATAEITMITMQTTGCNLIMHDIELDGNSTGAQGVVFTGNVVFYFYATQVEIHHFTAEQIIGESSALIRGLIVRSSLHDGTYGFRSALDYGPAIISCDIYNCSSVGIYQYLFNWYTVFNRIFGCGVGYEAGRYEDHTLSYCTLCNTIDAKCGYNNIGNSVNLYHCIVYGTTDFATSHSSNVINAIGCIFRNGITKYSGTGTINELGCINETSADEVFVDKAGASRVAAEYRLDSTKDMFDYCYDWDTGNVLIGALGPDEPSGGGGGVRATRPVMIGI